MEFCVRCQLDRRIFHFLKFFCWQTSLFFSPTHLPLVFILSTCMLTVPHDQWMWTRGKEIRGLPVRKNHQESTRQLFLSYEGPDTSQVSDGPETSLAANVVLRSIGWSVSDRLARLWTADHQTIFLRWWTKASIFSNKNLEFHVVLAVLCSC